METLSVPLYLKYHCTSLLNDDWVICAGSGTKGVGDAEESEV